MILKINELRKTMPHIRQRCQPGVRWLEYFLHKKISQGSTLWWCITPLLWKSSTLNIYLHFQGEAWIAYRCFYHSTTPWGRSCLLIQQISPVHLSPSRLILTLLSHGATLAQGADLPARGAPEIRGRVGGGGWTPETIFTGFPLMEP